MYNEINIINGAYVLISLDAISISYEIIASLTNGW